MASVVICILLVLLVTKIPTGDWERGNWECIKIPASLPTLPPQLLEVH